MANIIISSGTTNITSGKSLTSVHILNSGAVVVFTGGKLVDAYVYRGGCATVSSGGLIDSALLDSGGSIFICSKGVINQVDLYREGWVSAAGGSVYSATVNSGGALEVRGVSSGGSVISGFASNVNIVSGGQMWLGLYAMGSAVNVMSGSLTVALPGGVLQEAVIGSGTTSGSSESAQVHIEYGAWGNLNYVYTDGLMVVSNGEIGRAHV